MEGRLDGGCAAGRRSGRWEGLNRSVVSRESLDRRLERWYLVGEHSAAEGVVSSRRIAVAVEEVAGIRRIVVAAEGRHSFHTEVDRRILVVAGCSTLIAVNSHHGVRKILTDIAEAGILHTAAAGVGEALGRSLPGYGSLGRGSTTC